MIPPAGQPRRKVPPADPVLPAVSVPAVPHVPVSTRKRRAPTEALTIAQQKVTPTDEAAFATIEAELGGRQRLAAMLASAQFPPAESAVVGMIADPRNDVESLAKVCALGGVSLARLMKMFREASLTRGQLIAMARIAAALPDVAAAVMEDAVPGQRTCQRCDGLTTILVPTVEDPAASAQCPVCRGKGMVKHVPELAVQKTALELGGLLTKGGQSITTIVAQQGAGGGNTNTPGSFDQLVSALDEVVYGRGRERFAAPVDAEFTDGGPA